MQFVFSIEVRNRSLFTPGKGGGFWAKQGEILPIPPVNVASLNDPPYHVFIFQIWVVPPLNPSKVFSDPPASGFSVTTDPPFFLPKIKWSPQAINNDRSCGEIPFQYFFSSKISYVCAYLLFFAVTRSTFKAFPNTYFLWHSFGHCSCLIKQKFDTYNFGCQSRCNTYYSQYLVQ